MWLIFSDVHVENIAKLKAEMAEEKENSSQLRKDIEALKKEVNKLNQTKMKNGSLVLNFYIGQKFLSFQVLLQNFYRIGQCKNGSGRNETS